MKEETAPPDAALVEALCKEALRIAEDAIHSAKRHFNASDLWGNLHYWLGIPATILAAAASTASIKNAPEAAQILGLVAAVITALMTFLKPNDRAAQHRSVGNQYLNLRNDARMFCEIDLIEPIEDGKRSERLRRLAQRRNELNGTAPSTPRWAFEKSREGIAQGEATYEADKRA